MTTNFYLLPLDTYRHARGPKYLKWRYTPGLPGKWSLKDFGNDSPIGLIATEATLTQSDVLPLDEWNAKHRDRLAAYLKDGGIEADWLLKAADYRDALQRIAGLTQAYQSGSDTPHLWQGREIYFGFAKLNPLDRQAYEAERLARAQEQIEELRVRWSVQKPAFDWKALLKIFALNPLSIITAALPATDVFTGTNGTALQTYSSSWSINTGGFYIQSNAVAPNASGAACFARWNADTFANDQYSKGTIIATSGGLYIGVACRISTSGAVTAYDITGDSADRIYFEKFVAGTETVFSSTTTYWSANDVVEIRASGTTITARRNGSTDAALGSTTDSSIASGAAGISGYGSGTTSRLDSWEGGNLSTAVTLSISDGVTVGDSAALKVVSNVNVSDALTVGESITVTIPGSGININISDGLTVGESATVALLLKVNVSDDVGVVDAPFSVETIPGMSVSDNLTIGESVTVAVSAPQINVSDGITLGETVTPNLILKPAVSDGVTVGESVSASLQTFVQVSDALTVGESVALGLTIGVNVSDGVTVGEAVTVMPVLPVNVSDGVTVGEIISSKLVALVNVSDSVTVGESVALNISTQLSVSDGLTIGETTALTIVSVGQIAVNVQDGLSIGESVALTLTTQLSVSDGVTVGESATLALSTQLRVSDGVTVGEAVSLSIVSIGALTVNVSDGLTVGEITSLNIISAGAIALSVSDGLTIGETVALAVSALQVNVSDGLTLSETVSLNILTAGQVTINVSDGLTIGESTGQSIVTALSVTDGVTLGEQTAANIPLSIGASDALVIGESSGVQTVLRLSMSEGVTVGDTVERVLVFAPGATLLLNVSDGVTVGDLSTLIVMVWAKHLHLRQRSSSLNLRQQSSSLNLKDD